jgi:hypothetical protein
MLASKKRVSSYGDFIFSGCMSFLLNTKKVRTLSPITEINDTINVTTAWPVHLPPDPLYSAANILSNSNSKFILIN